MKDGRYAVNGHFEIRHPKLPDLDWRAGDKGRKVYFSVDEETEAAERWLDGQADESFEPSFAAYEEFLTALRIEPGRPFVEEGMAGGE